MKTQKTKQKQKQNKKKKKKKKEKIERRRRKKNPQSAFELGLLYSNNVDASASSHIHNLVDNSLILDSFFLVLQSVQISVLEKKS